MKIISDLENFLEWLDSFRDRILFIAIKPYWPRRIGPNWVSFLRVAIGIALFVMLFFFGVENKVLVMILFCVGVITDFIDGPIARGTDKVTEFGAILDPVADRILLVPIAVYALFFQYKWLLLVLFFTEVFGAAASLHFKSKEIYLESSIFGKIKMAFVSIAFIAILITWPAPPPQLFIYALWSAVPLTLLGALAKILELKNKAYAENKNF